MIKEISDIVGFSRLSKSYDAVFFDKCAIQGIFPINGKKQLSYLQKMSRGSHLQNNFIDILEHLPNIMISQGVFDEFCPSKTDYKRLIKDIDLDFIGYFMGNEEKNKYWEFLKLLGERYRSCKELRGKSESDKRVFRCSSPEESDLYEIYENKYFYAKLENELSSPDYDLLITSMVYLERHSEGKGVALVSNDRGVGNAWKEITRQENSLGQGLDFLIRVSKNQFVPYEDFLSYRKSNKPQTFKQRHFSDMTSEVTYQT